MKRLVSLGLAVVMLCSLAPAALGAAVSVEYGPVEAALPNLGISSDGLGVSDMREDDDYYYFLLRNNESGSSFSAAYIKAVKSGESMTLYSVNSEPELEGYMIEDFDVSENGDIWMLLRNTEDAAIKRFAVIGNERGVEVWQPLYSNHLALGEDCAIWIDTDAGLCYPWYGIGSEGENFDLRLDGKSVMAFTMRDGALYYIDEDGGLHCAWFDEYSYLGGIADMMGLEGSSFWLGSASLVSAGGTVWASASVMYALGEGSGTNDGIAYSGLIPVLEPEAKAIVLGGVADTIQYAATNADGSMYFIMQHVFPITPYAAPDKDTNYYAVTVTGESGNYTAATETLTEQPARKYTDQNGDTWSFGLEPGVTVTKPDGTSVAYVAPGGLGDADIAVSLNGTRVGFDVSPYIQNGRTMAPMRGIAYLLGAETSWDQGSKTASFVRGDTKIEITIGEQYAYVDGEAVALEAPAELKGGRTMVPLRFISAAFGVPVDWDEGTRTVIIEG